MKGERNRDLKRRAAKHAALADPARLAIVDLLAPGDASPKELQVRLAMPSNLLAHHVKVLEKQGILLRARSEADRRRTYLQLVPGAMDGLDDPRLGVTHTAQRVVFVCTGNSARSQLAAALWRRVSTVPATSAGTEPAKHLDAGAVAVARRHGLPLRARRPRKLDKVRTDGDLVVTVCDRAHEQLGAKGSLHWSISDPVRTGSEAAFEAAFAELGRRVLQLAPHVVLPGQEAS